MTVRINTGIILLMTIKTQLNDSMKDAMKSGDEIRKRTTRMALAAIKQVEVDKRIELDDPAIMALLQKEIKNRRESLEEAKKANRADLIEANEAEIKVLEAFLPKAMPAEELREPGAGLDFLIRELRVVVDLLRQGFQLVSEAVYRLRDGVLDCAHTDLRG